MARNERSEYAANNAIASTYTNPTRDDWRRVLAKRETAQIQRRQQRRAAPRNVRGFAFVTMLAAVASALVAVICR